MQQVLVYGLLILPVTGLVIDCIIMVTVVVLGVDRLLYISQPVGTGLSAPTKINQARTSGEIPAGSVFA